jgi:hypothetical protein
MELTLVGLMVYHEMLEMEISKETDAKFREYLIGRLEQNLFLFNVLKNGRQREV